MPVLRPFSELFEREHGSPLLRISGQLRSGRFLVDVQGAEFSLPTVETGRDERGPWALLEPLRVALPQGYQLSLAFETAPPVEMEEPSPSARLLLAEEASAGRQGRSFAVHFDARGWVNGTSSCLASG